MAGGSNTRGESVVSKALTILGTFDDAHTWQTLTSISERSGLPMATCHRHVGDLIQWGALIRGPSGQISIGHRLWELGLLAPVNRELKHVAAPFLQDLYLATRCIVHLTVRDGLNSFHLDRIAGQEKRPQITKIGARTPLHWSAAGKVLLAFAPHEIIDGLLADMAPATAHTITSPAQLERQLRDVRSRGYATSVQERAIGRFGLAVPVFNLDRTVTIAIGVVSTQPMRQPQHIAPALQVAASGISRTLNWVRRD